MSKNPGFFTVVRPCTVRFLKIENPTVRFGAVLRKRKSYGAVRCGFKKAEILRCGSVRFSDIVNPTVRFGAVFKNRKCYGAVRCFHVSYGAVRCGFQI